MGYLAKAWAALRGELSLWNNLRLSSKALGKYVIAAACVLHLGWALLFMCCPFSIYATPAHVLVVVFAGRYRAAVVLIAVSLTAAAAMRYKAKHPYAGTGTVVALLPQQLVLLMSSIAGIVAVLSERYPDGTMRTWTFILADQLPIIMGAFLYSAVVIEIAFHQDADAL